MALGDPTSLFGQAGGIDAPASPAGGGIFGSLNPNERQLLLINMLAGLSQGIAQANRPSTVKQPALGFLSQALGGATQGAAAGFQSALQNRYLDQRTGLEKVQTLLAMQKAKTEADKQAQLAKLFGGGGSTGAAPAAAPSAGNAAPSAGAETTDQGGTAASPPASPAGLDDPQLRQAAQMGYLTGNWGAYNDLVKQKNDPNYGLIHAGNVVGRLVDGKFQPLYQAPPTSVQNVTMNVPQELKEQQVIGESLGKAYSSIQDAATAANGKITRFQRLGDLLSKVDTGAFAGTTTDLKAAAKAAGIDLGSLGIADDVAPAQAARALSNQLALELRNPAGGAGMPGALSDRDLNILQQSTPGLTLTPEGNKLLIDYQVRLAQRDRQIAKLASDYRAQQRKGGHDFDEGFNDVLAKWSDAHPLFNDADLANIKAATAGASAPSATPAPPPPAATSALPSGITPEQAIQQAQDAIAHGKNAVAVQERLKSWGLSLPGQ